MPMNEMRRNNDQSELLQLVPNYKNVNQTIVVGIGRDMPIQTV